MKKLTKEEKDAQCRKEIKATLILAIIVCAWHIITAFVLAGNRDAMFLGIPAFTSVSCLGAFIIMLVGALYLLKNVFIDFDYDDENAIEEGGKAHE